jgi:hypothetical protein
MQDVTYLMSTVGGGTPCGGVLYVPLYDASSASLLN